MTDIAREPSEGVALDSLIATKKSLEREREGLLEQAALRLRAIAKINDVIATLRGLQTDDIPAPTLAKIGRKTLDPDALRGWVLEFALAQTRAFSTGDVGRWLGESGKLPDPSPNTRTIAIHTTRILQDDGRFQVQGSGAQTKFIRRQLIAQGEGK